MGQSKRGHCQSNEPIFSLICGIFLHQLNSQCLQGLVLFSYPVCYSKIPVKMANGSWGGVMVGVGRLKHSLVSEVVIY